MIQIPVWQHACCHAHRTAARHCDRCGVAAARWSWAALSSLMAFEPTPDTARRASGFAAFMVAQHRARNLAAGASTEPAAVTEATAAPRRRPRFDDEEDQPRQKAKGRRDAWRERLLTPVAFVSISALVLIHSVSAAVEFGHGRIVMGIAHLIGVFAAAFMLVKLTVTALEERFGVMFRMRVVASDPVRTSDAPHVSSGR